MQQTWDNRSRGNQFLLQLASQSPKYFLAEARAPPRRHASLHHAMPRNHAMLEPPPPPRRLPHLAGLQRELSFLLVPEMSSN